MMKKRFTEIKIFVSSPGDVTYERNRLEYVAREINNIIGAKEDIFVKIISWETHCVPGMGRPQGLINEQIGDYDIFVGIMWKRFGSPTGVADSGTEEEFRLAYKSWRTNESPLRILFYFSQKKYLLNSMSEVEQLKKVIQFKEELRNKGLTSEYPGPKSFADVVRPHLSRIILELGKARTTRRRDRIKITSPIKNQVSKEYVKVSGTGAKAGNRVFLISVLNSKFFKPYEKVVTAQKDGRWSHEKCRLLNVRAERLLYALSVNPGDLDAVKKIFKRHNKSLTIPDLELELSEQNIPYQISKAKRLVRVETERKS